MIFSEKLQVLRKSKGLTQEDLAAELSVSRQAIAKWESGLAYPDISNLISLSEYLLVTVDYLVKDDACQKQAALLPEPTKKFVAFLLRAKQKTYAGKGAETQSSRPASHDLQYREGSYLYYDTYLGGERFSGEEAVWEDDRPLFSMNYVGRVLDKAFSGDFLKAALSNVPEEMPYRGPECFHDGEYVCRCSVSGNLDWFQGYEEIFFGSIRVYECFFHGGAVL